MTSFPIPTTVTRKLGALRRAVAMWFAVDGGARLAWLAVGLVTLSLGVDRYFRMDRAQRLIVLLAMVGLVGWGIWRWLVRPLRSLPDDEKLAERVQRRYPQLDDALITALQFGRPGAGYSPSASPSLVEAAVRQGAARAEPLDFTGVLDRRKLKRNGVRLAVALLVMLAMGLVMPGTMSLWAQRNLLLAEVAWPQDTRLRIVGLNDAGVLVVPRGDDLNLRVEADPDGTVPDVVHVDYRLKSGRDGSEQMVGVGEHAFRATFRNVLEPFTFRVRGGDAWGDWRTVRLVDRPAALPGDRGLMLTVDPPAYTGRTPRTLPVGQGSYRVLRGSRLVIDGYATKPLAAATLTRGRQTLASLEVSEAPAQTVAIRTGRDREVEQTFDPGPRRFQGEIAGDQLESGVYQIELRDVDGLAGRSPLRFTLRVQPDQPPSVRMQLQGIGELITSEARIPFELQVSDDFAVADVQLAHQLGGRIGMEGDAASAEAETVRRPLPELADRLPAEELGPVEAAFELAPLDAPLDARFTLSLEARDNDTVTGPNVGTSRPVSFKVVSAQQLRDELLRREQEQRVEFERLVKDQQALVVDAEAALAGLRADAAGKLATDQWQQLTEIEKKQRLAGGRCEQVVAQFRQILAEVINNRLEASDGPTSTRLRERIIDPLRYLVADAIPAAADKLDAARKTALDADERAETLAAALAEQRAILSAMEQVLRSMVEMEGFQEAVNLLREIMETQEQVHEQTTERLDERIEGIFGE